MFRYPYVCCACPVCGRPLEVREEYLGRKVTCVHCRGQFVARRETHPARAGARQPGSLLERADRLLSIAARRLAGGVAPVAQ
ncbi:MAG: hypothetical protein JW888_11510 [Pirellulales bacterium]|nr:hypothetical protein [Pirellulales bacterium]